MQNEADQSSASSPPLVEAVVVFDRLMAQRASDFIFNRRGFARVMVCRDCGFEAKCPIAR